MDRHAVYRILNAGLYDDKVEKKNKKQRFQHPEEDQRFDVQAICRLKLNDPSLPARQAGRLTGHGHGNNFCRYGGKRT